MQIKAATLKNRHLFLKFNEINSYQIYFFVSLNNFKLSAPHQLQVFDANKDGRLQLSEMAKLLPVKENFLCRQVFKVSKVYSRFEYIFSYYSHIIAYM